MDKLYSILITGAGSGVGQGMAEAFALDGHSVIVSDLDSAAAERVAGAIQREGGRTRSLALDVTSDESIDRGLGTLQEPVDVLINNAGLQYVAPLESFPQQEWNQLIDVMLGGACRMTRAVLPGMRRKEWGRVINIGSIHALVASPYKSAYIAAKHGLLGFSKTIALETADTDITINSICPSYVRTPLVEKQIRALALEHDLPEDRVVSEIMLKPMPKGSFITIDEIVGTARFLISPAARNITGHEIVLDGGWTCR